MRNCEVGVGGCLAGEVSILITHRSADLCFFLNFFVVIVVVVVVVVLLLLLLVMFFFPSRK